MTTVLQIAEWFDRGVQDGATHMIVRWDRFDGPEGDYPVYVRPDQSVHELASKSSEDPVQEVYILDPARRAEQLVPGTRVFNFE